MYTFRQSENKIRRKVRFSKMQPKVQYVAGECLIFPFTQLTPLPHLHASFEMMVPRSGEARVRLDGETHGVSPGELLTIFPGVPHCYAPGPACEGLMLIFSEKMLSEAERDWFDVRPERPVLRLDGVDRDVSHCLERLGEMASPGALDEALARAYLSLMFIRLLPELRPREVDGLATRDLLYRAMRYMSQNLAAPLSIRGTAKALGVNTYYLSHVLNDHLHMGFRAYLNALRINRARRYLRGTARPIEEVATACGFANLRTFDRVFAERCGCTPREFRKASSAVR